MSLSINLKRENILNAPQDPNHMPSGLARVVAVKGRGFIAKHVS
jgi:hypothetical protein